MYLNIFLSEARRPWTSWFKDLLRLVLTILVSFSDVEQVVIFGPARNFTALESMNADPSIFLYGLDEETTVSAFFY